MLSVRPLSAETLTVMSFNIYGGGANDGKPIDETVAAIRAAGADIIGLQETRLEGETCTADNCPADGPSVGPAIAEALGFYYYEQEQQNVALWANGIASRYPIGAATPNDLGVAIDVNGTTVWLFNIHHDDEPYQPYQAVGIEYGPAPFTTDPAQLVEWANKTRGPAMDLLFADMAAAEGAIAFVTGDFNEPSLHDWTDATVAVGQQPVAVPWPTTERLIDAGFVDAYRAVWPDPVTRPAYTWTPMWTTEDDPEDKHDRIDFVFVRGATVTAAGIVGEDGPRSDIKVEPWPSDHRAVVATVAF
jgi:exonuclease III